jgi:DNA-binding CsgD family transcriptional regulator
MNALFPLPPMSVDAATFADMLDGLDFGTYLVEANARLLHANTAGQAILDTCNVLLEIRGQLMACDPAISQTLRQVLAASGCCDAVPGAIAIPMSGLDGDRYVAHVLPLRSGAHQCAGTAVRAVAAVFVRKAALATPARPDALRDAFKLTATELRVLLAIVELGGVPQVARALGVAGSTIKTHLRRLFEKTGATRQADFVKLVAGYATPLRDRRDTRSVGAPR